MTLDIVVSLRLAENNEKIGETRMTVEQFHEIGEGEPDSRHLRIGDTRFSVTKTRRNRIPQPLLPARGTFWLRADD